MENPTFEESLQELEKNRHAARTRRRSIRISSRFV